ncbi:MAG: 5-(carboxyamino)imidazole ribonucleotide mutase [Methanomassiliicoccales archaeon]|nr:5-(carboxyamino)imidazole ribonucleotide mutase [Methanomassiliicoccales archaeon]NYT15966.1 5-(carboxyamino)imidazole ribonucleotide mutase [Methanomassiliicoccales archaeon]
MPDVLVVLGSKSDLDVGRKAIAILEQFDVEAKMVVASAHRTPERVKEMVETSSAKVFIAIAGLSAALPGVIASTTPRPVIGVPVSGKMNLDSVLSVLQMPPGIPVAAVGLDRGENASLLAISILALSDEKLNKKLLEYREELADKVIKDSMEVEDS